MRIRALCGLVFVAMMMPAPAARGEETVVLEEDFSSLDGWLDISTLPCFRGEGDGLFTVESNGDSPSGNAVTIKASLQGNYGSNYPQRGSAALDWRFAQPIDRQHGPITVEWAMRYEKRDDMNQNNRFMVILLKDMTPKADPSTVTSYSTGPYTTLGQEYGIPTYHVRITSDQDVDKSFIYLCYGQEIEKTGSDYIPGFISPYSADGGNGDWSDPNKLKWLDHAGDEIASRFVHYRWVIGENWQYIEQDGQVVKRVEKTADDDPNLADGRCFVGEETALPSTIDHNYPDYEYFRIIEGIRLYMRNATAESGTWISHVKVTQNAATVEAVQRARSARRADAARTARTSPYTLRGRTLRGAAPARIPHAVSGKLEAWRSLRARR
jgi:hypothetical protein